jgi:hypothetical protein
VQQHAENCVMQIDLFSPLHGTTSSAADIVLACSRIFVACTAVTVLVSGKVDGVEREVSDRSCLRAASLGA